MTTVLALPMALAVAMGTPRAEAGPLDPNAFASLGTLDITSNNSYGGYTFNTTNDTLTDDSNGAVLSTGVTSNGVAVFDFSEITLSGAYFNTIGNAPLALLSRGGISLTDTMVNLDGGVGFGGGGIAGPGGYAGGRQGGAGDGPGGGVGGVVGGGGGFGGAGYGFGSASTGQPYGNLGLQLVGGSGGGGVSTVGGGGGGAIEIGAIGLLSINGGTISAVGGTNFLDGGGGGGGGIFLHAGTVSLVGSDVLDVSGGNGGMGTGGSGYVGTDPVLTGGGGGGRILIETDSFTASGSGNFANLAGGTGSLRISNGGDGVLTIDRLAPASVPEPSSLILLGLALPIVARAWRRRAS